MRWLALALLVACSNDGTSKDTAEGSDTGSGDTGSSDSGEDTDDTGTDDTGEDQPDAACPTSTTSCSLAHPCHAIPLKGIGKNAERTSRSATGSRQTRLSWTSPSPSPA